MKIIQDMTIEEFKKVPTRKWNEDIGEFDSLIIMPVGVNTFSVIKWKMKKAISKIFRLEESPIYQVGGIHDSGYRMMDFIAVKKGYPICKLSGCSDVLHINGISGCGNFTGSFPEKIKPINWSIDCLLNSGLLRLFCNRKLTCGGALSSFEIFAEEVKR